MFGELANSEQGWLADSLQPPEVAFANAYSLATWLEQFDRVARGIVDQNLFAARTRNDLTAKVRTGLCQPLHQQYKIVSFKHQPIPAARRGLGSIGKRTRG